MAIPQNFIIELTERADILDVVSRSVSLTKKGRYHFGKCPFHADKTPSFSVTEHKQMYYCYSCSRGGSVINFIMESENLSYVDAIHFLANMYALTVPQDSENIAITRKKAIGIEILKKSAMFFYKNLTPEIKSHLKERGLGKKIMDDFGIGYSTNGWQDLLDYLTKLGYQKKDIADVGLIIPNKNGGYYDRFRGRIMFPIIDIRGNVIAFGARAVGDAMPKYINSPETFIYSKSQNLYALNIAKKTDSDYIILAEGYMDVIALHQSGFNQAVASLGTSLTENQARMIAKVKKRVVIAYDSDDAGKKAAERAIQILKNEDISVKVLSIKGAKDPDEYIRINGKTMFENLIEKSESDMEYRILEAKSKYNIDIPEEKIAFLQESCKLISNNDSMAEREIYIGRLAKTIDISTEAISIEVQKNIKNRKKSFEKKEKSKIMMPKSTISPKDKNISYSDIKSAVAEETLINSLFASDEFIDLACKNIDYTQFSSKFLADIYKKILETFQSGQTINMAIFENDFTNIQKQHLAKIINKEIRVQEKIILDCIKVIKERYARRNGDLSTFSNDL